MLWKSNIKLDITSYQITIVIPNGKPQICKKENKSDFKKTNNKTKCTSSPPDKKKNHQNIPQKQQSKNHKNPKQPMTMTS